MGLGLQILERADVGFEWIRHGGTIPQVRQKWWLWRFQGLVILVRACPKVGDGVELQCVVRGFVVPRLRQAAWALAATLEQSGQRKEGNHMTIPENINDRVNWAIGFAWNITICKIANGEIKINKEASLQMHYSSILKTVLDIIKFASADRIDIELETEVIIERKRYLIDILLTYKNGIVSTKHSIELKCYKTFASSGRRRGGSDIFMREVYRDIYNSELYSQHKFTDYTTCLILTDYSNFIAPRSKETKNWNYDISQGHSFSGGHFTTSVGGKEVDFKLRGTYEFDWQKNGDYWGAIIRPK